MTIDRTEFVGGPAKITIGATVLYSKGDVQLDFVRESHEVESSVQGPFTEIQNSNAVLVKFQPKSVWSYKTVLLPAAFIAPSYMGAFVFPAADQVVVVAGMDGGTWTLPNCRLTQMPDVFLGMGGDLFGECVLTGLHANNTDTAATDGLAAFTAGSAPSIADITDDHLEVPVVGAWTGITGFSGVQAAEGWRLTHELRLAPVTQQKQLAGYRLTGYRAMLSCQPMNVSQANLKAALRADSTGGGAGTNLATAGADLAVTGTGISVTLKKAALRTGGFRFGSSVLRQGDFGWVSCQSGARVVLA